MDEDNLLSLPVLILVQRLAEHAQLVFEHFAVGHVGGVVEQFMDVQVHLHQVVLALRFLDRLRLRTFGRLLLQQRFLQRICVGEILADGFIVLHQVIHQRRLLKIDGRTEGVQLVELHGVHAQLHAHGRFQLEALVLLVSDELHRHMLQFIEHLLAELLQEELRIRFDDTLGTYPPAFAFRTQIRIIKVIVAVVHQVGVKVGSRNRLHVLRDVCQHHIEPFALLGLCRTIGNLRLPFLLLRRFGLCLRLALDVIVIGINDHALTDEHGDVETVGIFHQHRVFTLESFHDAASHFTQETDFISNLHLCICF